MSPVFVIDIVQEVITFLQFVIVMAFLAALLWLFRCVRFTGVTALSASCGLAVGCRNMNCVLSKQVLLVRLSCARHELCRAHALPAAVLGANLLVLTRLPPVPACCCGCLLLLLFHRPAEDSPYLLMGDGVDTLDTALGVDEEEEEDRCGRLAEWWCGVV
jgi:hypothetical protein